MAVKDVQKKLKEIQDMPTPKTSEDMWKQFVEFTKEVALALEDIDSALEEVNDGLDPDKLLEELQMAEKEKMRKLAYPGMCGVQRLI